MSTDSDSDSLVIVALGSNLGDSARLLRDAFAQLASQAASGFQHSSLWTSEPVDCPPGSPPFLNAVAVWHPRKPCRDNRRKKTGQSLSGRFLGQSPES